MAQIKGLLLNAWMTFLKLRFGDLAVASALDLASAEDRRLLSVPFLASSWYAYGLVDVLSRTTTELAGDADRNLPEEIGRFMAQHAFTGIYRSLIAADPIKQVEKAAWMEGFFLNAAYNVETEITGPTSCTMRCTYESAVKPFRAICGSLTGFWLEMIELSGANSVTGDHTRCVLDGGDCCEFKFEWRVQRVT